MGKSTVVTGIVRSLARRGVDVAPFKAQNMSNNARVGLVPDSANAVYGEIGISQYVQARAAELQPTTDHNPVLLKPRGGGESQLIVHGQPVSTQEAGSYYDQHWDDARTAAVEAFERLSATHDVIVAEGAGSIAEINLSHRDLANVETARFADADVLLLGDIERGGVFASLHGTMDLLEDDLSDRVIGTVINKFRGDRSLLEPGIRQLEDITGVPVLGVLPYADPGLPEEDTLSIPAVDERGLRGGDDGMSEAQSVTIGVPRWPRISNVTDVEPLVEEPGVRIALLPLDDDFAAVDAIVLPGTKNAVDDLIAARNAGFDRTVRTFDGPIIGLCGGYQLLGERLENANEEGTVDVDTVSGFGLLPVTTTFSRDKRVRHRSVAIEGKGPVEGATGTIEGYEIHSGDTTAHGNLPEPLEPGSVNLEGVLGTYLHGLFENQSVRDAFVDRVFEAADIERPPIDREESSPFEAAAELITTHLDDSVLAEYATE